MSGKQRDQGIRNVLSYGWPSGWDYGEFQGRLQLTYAVVPLMDSGLVYHMGFALECTGITALFILIIEEIPIHPARHDYFRTHSNIFSETLAWFNTCKKYNF